MDKKTIATIAIIALFAGIFGFVLFSNHQDNKALDERGVVTTATAVRVDESRVSRSSSDKDKNRSSEREYTAVFSYVVDDESYTIKGKRYKWRADAEDELNSVVKVQYLPDNPNTARIVSNR